MLTKYICSLINDYYSHIHKIIKLFIISHILKKLYKLKIEQLFLSNYYFQIVVYYQYHKYILKDITNIIKKKNSNLRRSEIEKGFHFLNLNSIKVTNIKTIKLNILF